MTLLRASVRLEKRKSVRRGSEAEWLIGLSVGTVSTWRTSSRIQLAAKLSSRLSANSGTTHRHR
ncbi:hypothetical protein PsYK624_023490 [Phanerochaete sordida]|uniref:Uncharacterized protein n=1 Tax=Phanerochaete sordida TaxID=48140 RepID=A0A9P3G248_9APHY|nr:hypothetical protein PsYK624_023490 [Phanerochaete sordida]